MRNTANRASRRPLRTRTHALAAALGAAFCPVAGAQSTSDSADAPTTITVTATRVVRSGFTAPTPTTMLGSDQIAERAQTSLGEILNEQPQFRATLSGASAGPGLRGAQTVPDLRGLGGVRTLVLFDGQRAVPATTTGLTDLNLIPTLLVNRVEVVTGGASAGWGSDAVAGVVNVVLNRRLEGTRADLMIGQSRFGDSSQNRFSLASGAHFQNGRGHIVGGVDIEDNRGVGDQFTRPWGRDNYGVFSNTAGATNGLPQRLVLPT